MNSVARGVVLAAVFVLGAGLPALELVERTRGEAEAPPDRLALERTLWLDFDGGGWTAVYNQREKPIGEASAAAMLAAISKNGPIDVVLPSSNSPAILTGGLDLSQFTQAVFGWAPTIPGDVTRYGTLTRAEGLAGVCYLDGFCGAGKEVGEFDLTPNGSTRVLFTGKATDSPHVGLGFDDQIMLWGYDRNQQHGSNWGNWDDEGPCCKAGNTPEITTVGWRYVIYLR